MENKNNIRKSNIELLRILAIIMIIAHHITCHCFKVQLEDKSFTALGEFFNNAVFVKKLLLPQLFMPAGKIGNIIFILITGYFLIDRKIDIIKQIKKLFSQLIFVVPIIVLGSFLYYKIHSNTFTGIQTFEIFNSDFWFIGLYIGIIVIAHLFLNSFLNKLSKKEYISFLLIMFSIISIEFLRIIISDISIYLLTLLAGIFVYSLGGYIRLYNPFKNIRTIIIVLIIIISIFAICINNYNNAIVNINSAIEKNAEGMYHSLMAYTEFNVFCILIGVSLFELFSRIKMPSIKVINYVSSATFIIYLIHDNNFFRSIWKETNWIAICYNDYFKFILLYIKWICLIFVLGIILYTLYCLLLRIIHSKFISKIIFKLK